MRETLPLSDLYEHMRTTHGLAVTEATEATTPQEKAKNIEIYTRNKEMHSRVHGGMQLQRSAGTPEHVHQPFVPKKAA